MTQLAIDLPTPREEWRPIAGFEGLYEVSPCGNVRSIRSGRQVCATKRSGYLYVALWRGNKGFGHAVHRLVLLAFKPAPNAELLQANHIDGVKTNNTLSNLEWVTPSENIRHSYRVLGRKPSPPKWGALNHNARPIRRLIGDDAVETFPSIADAVRAGYRACCIVDVCKGRQATHRGFRWAYA